MRELGIVVILALLAVATAGAVLWYHGNLINAPTPDVVLEDGRAYGDSIIIGQGEANVFVEVDDQGRPESIGVTMTNNSIIGLPSQTPTAYVLEMPGGFEQTLPYTHAMVEWNPQGHEPPGVYDVPHFDFHFYMIPESVRLQIGIDDPGFEVYPDAAYLPNDYGPIPGGVPRMGAHWVDGNTPELNGVAFTETMIWGTYNGEVAFLEPMITMNFLLSAENFSTALKQPDLFPISERYYPTSYSISHENGGYRISLDGLTLR
jgi:hypothetical protein